MAKVNSDLMRGFVRVVVVVSPESFPVEKFSKKLASIYQLYMAQCPRRH